MNGQTDLIDWLTDRQTDRQAGPATTTTTVPENLVNKHTVMCDKQTGAKCQMMKWSLDTTETCLGEYEYTVKILSGKQNMQ